MLRLLLQSDFSTFMRGQVGEVLLLGGVASCSPLNLLQPVMSGLKQFREFRLGDGIMRHEGCDDFGRKLDDVCALS